MSRCDGSIAEAVGKLLQLSDQDRLAVLQSISQYSNPKEPPSSTAAPSVEESVQTSRPSNLSASSMCASPGGEASRQEDTCGSATYSESDTSSAEGVAGRTSRTAGAKRGGSDGSGSTSGGGGGRSDASTSAASDMAPDPAKIPLPPDMQTQAGTDPATSPAMLIGAGLRLFGGAGNAAGGENSPPAMGNQQRTAMASAAAEAMAAARMLQNAPKDPAMATPEVSLQMLQAANVLKEAIGNLQWAASGFQNAWQRAVVQQQQQQQQQPPLPQGRQTTPAAMTQQQPPPQPSQQTCLDASASGSGMAASDGKCTSRSVAEVLAAAAAAAEQQDPAASFQRFVANSDGEQQAAQISYNGTAMSQYAGFGGGPARPMLPGGMLAAAAAASSDLGKADASAGGDFASLLTAAHAATAAAQQQHQQQEQQRYYAAATAAAAASAAAAAAHQQQLQQQPRPYMASQQPSPLQPQGDEAASAERIAAAAAALQMRLQAARLLTPAAGGHAQQVQMLQEALRQQGQAQAPVMPSSPHTMTASAAAAAAAADPSSVWAAHAHARNVASAAARVWELRAQLANAALVADGMPQDTRLPQDTPIPPRQTSGKGANHTMATGAGKKGAGKGRSPPGLSPMASANGAQDSAGVEKQSAGDRKDKQAAQPQEEHETLRTHLQHLQTKDPKRIFIVRKINRLGFASPNILKTHFQQYGPVESVLVAHSHVRCNSRSAIARLRPSGLGFVLMEVAEHAKQILAQGLVHVVEGETIYLSPFDKRATDDAAEGQDATM